jgi:hypothetical protein
MRYLETLKPHWLGWLLLLPTHWLWLLHSHYAAISRRHIFIFAEPAGLAAAAAAIFSHYAADDATLSLTFSFRQMLITALLPILIRFFYAIIVIIGHAQAASRLTLVIDASFITLSWHYADIDAAIIIFIAAIDIGQISWLLILLPAIII